jgi:hypothetical protein
VTGAELIAAIELALQPLSAAYSAGATEADLYEASLFAVATKAVDAIRGAALITQDGSTAAPELHFRRAPGNLWLGDFTYARCTWPGTVRELEIHLGIYVAGKSGVAHECDVAILDAEEAARSRAGAVHPRARGLVAAMEAKHYVASPGIGVGRGFMGLAAELGQNKSSLAFPAMGSATLGRLLANRPCEAFDELIPDGAAARRLQAHLEQDMRNWLA